MTEHVLAEFARFEAGEPPRAAASDEVVARCSSTRLVTELTSVFRAVAAAGRPR